MVAWVPGVAYCCVAFMGYIKYSWVRGKHTVQYPELTHVIHTEINYLPGPKEGLHPLSTRPWHPPSDCRHVCECVEMYVGTKINDKSSRKSSCQEMTKWGLYQYFVCLRSEIPDNERSETVTPSTPLINLSNKNNMDYTLPLDCSLLASLIHRHKT